VIDGFGLVNEDRPELSLHAIYIIDPDGKIFYRKIARRRAYSNELLDALDYRTGTYRAGTYRAGTYRPPPKPPAAEPRS